MSIHDLDEKQKQILTIIVNHIKAGKVVEPIRPIIRSESYLIEGIERKFDRNFVWDLEVLCEAKLMEQRYSRGGGKSRRIYSITGAGYKAVKDNFKFPEEIEESKATKKKEKPAIINVEDIQSIWFANVGEIAKITNNPKILERVVNALTEQLLYVIEPEISSYKLVTYKRNVQELKTQIISTSPSASTIQNLLGALSFTENLGGSISLAVTVWPYLYPLLLIAKAKISKER